MKRLLSAALLALTTLATVTMPVVAATPASAAGSPADLAVVAAFNQVASSRINTPAINAWFDSLLALNPTATWGIGAGGNFFVVSATNTMFVLPAGPVPSGIKITTV